MKRKFLCFIGLILAMILVFAVPAKANAAGNPYFSGSGLKSSYEMGDTLRFSGTVYGDGDSIEKIYVHYYDPNNTNDCGEIATKYPGSLSRLSFSTFIYTFS